ncbi:hypothetical protein B0H34DRAFT_711120 [Crassisporium funariophilum]|nr:hypothetical protein B0H34DRAFT_711120 [Crassisporium funariophilum]
MSCLKSDAVDRVSFTTEHIIHNRNCCIALLGTIQTSFNLDNLPKCTGSWTVPNVSTVLQVVPTLHNLQKEGNYRLFKWDGITLYALLDTDARIFGLLAGKPAVPTPQHPSNNFDSCMDSLDTTDIPGLILDNSNGDNSDLQPWANVVTGFKHALKAVRLIGQALGAFPPVAGPHRRGNYFTLTSGISFGGNQTETQNLVHTRKEQRLIDSLLLNNNVEHVAAFQSESLGYIAPRVYKDIAVHIAKLMHAAGSNKKRDQLQSSFSLSVYPAGTFNLSPETITVLHNSSKNSRYNLCAVTVAEHFDSKRGGHLILYNLKLIPGEERVSFTQYCAGSLLCWVSHGYVTDASIKELHPHTWCAKMRAMNVISRASKGLEGSIP